MEACGSCAAATGTFRTLATAPKQAGSATALFFHSSKLAAAVGSQRAQRQNHSRRLSPGIVRVQRGGDYFTNLGSRVLNPESHFSLIYAGHGASSASLGFGFVRSPTAADPSSTSSASSSFFLVSLSSSSGSHRADVSASSAASNGASTVLPDAADVSPEATSPSSGTAVLVPAAAAAPRWEDLVSAEVAAEVTERLRRLEALMLVRRLYRDVIRGEAALRMPIPKVASKKEGTQELRVGRRRRGRSLNKWIKRAWGTSTTSGGSNASQQLKQQDGESAVERDGEEAREREAEEEEEEVVELVVEGPLEVLQCAEDIRELAVSLKGDMGRLEEQLSFVFEGEEGAVEKVKATVGQLGGQLESLAVRMEESLTEEQREEAREARQEEEMLDENVQARVLRRLEGLSSTGQALGSVVGQRLIESTEDLKRLDINTTLPVLQRASARAVRALQDTWRRLNGMPVACDLGPVAAGLPRPQSTLAEAEEKKVKLVLNVEALDRKLGEVSRAREAKLRQRNALARTKLATEIRALDDEVNEVRKELAVRTLQLEMQQIYIGLESELLLNAGLEDVRTDEEEALLIAEFGLLDADLAPLLTAVNSNEAILVSDDELGVLATDIPDLKQRLGIVEAPSVPLQQRVKITAEEAKAKVQEGSDFFWRALRLLGGDVVYAGRLFWAAANGITLKVREVQTLRRTAKDLLVLIPFTIILIAPITPVGHVAAFSFLQKYFPGFFPSSFSPRRQEVMKRYELLRAQMGTDLLQLEEAKAAVLTEVPEGPDDTTHGGGGGSGGGGGGFLHGVSEGGRSGKASEQAGSGAGRPARLLRDEPRKMQLLQEKLPGISRLVAELRSAETRTNTTSDTQPQSSSEVEKQSEGDTPNYLRNGSIIAAGAE